MGLGEIFLSWRLFDSKCMSIYRCLDYKLILHGLVNAIRISNVTAEKVCKPSYSPNVLNLKWELEREQQNYWRSHRSYGSNRDRKVTLHFSKLFPFHHSCYPGSAWICYWGRIPNHCATCLHGRNFVWVSNWPSICRDSCHCIKKGLASFTGTFPHKFK